MNELSLSTIALVGTPLIFTLLLIAYPEIRDMLKRRYGRPDVLNYESPTTERNISLELKLSTEQLEYLVKCYQHGLSKLDPTHTDYSEFCLHLAQFSDELNFRARNNG